MLVFCLDLRAQDYSQTNEDLAKGPSFVIFRD